MKSLRGFFSFLFLSALLFTGACGMKGGQQSAYSRTGISYDMALMESAAAAPAAAGGANLYGTGGVQPGGTAPETSVVVGQTRKLVKTADLRLRVENLESMEESLANLTGKYKAWLASTSIYENTRYYSVRVPSDSYDSMLAELADLGRLLQRSENAEDVTLRYYDLESRLETKRELLKTYQGYLGTAKNIDEIMTVESRIADLQQEIDQTGTQFRNLASLVDYSTINVELTGAATAPSYSEPTLKDKLEELFGSFGTTVSSGLVVLVGIIIYGIPAALVLILFFSLFFGRIGLLKKLWYFAAEKKSVAEKPERSLIQKEDKQHADGALTQEQAEQPLGAAPSGVKKSEGKKAEDALTPKEVQQLKDGALTKDEIEMLLAGGPPTVKRPNGGKPTEILTQEEINYILEAITTGENKEPPPWGKPSTGSKE